MYELVLERKLNRSETSASLFKVIKVDDMECVPKLSTPGTSIGTAYEALSILSSHLICINIKRAENDPPKTLRLKHPIIMAKDPG